MLSEAQRMRFKMALETKRRELLGNIRNQVADLAIGDGVHDPIDQIQCISQRDEAVNSLDRLSRTLSNVERSLRAISEGRYGDCAECGGPIAIKRLEILPWAARCVCCEARMEQSESTGGLRAVPVPPFDENREVA